MFFVSKLKSCIFAYKVIFDLVSDACNEFFTMSKSTIPTRGHTFKAKSTGTVVWTLVNISLLGELFNPVTGYLLRTNILKA